MHWHIKTAKLGNSDAQFKIGLAYLNGIGLEKNEELTIECFTNATGQGNGSAARHLKQIEINKSLEK